MSLILTAIGLLLAAADYSSQAAQSWQWAVATDLTREKVVGLLNLPDLVAGGCGPVQPASAALYDAPSASGRSIGSITLRVADRQPDGSSCGDAQLIVQRTDGSPDEDLPTDETDYEVQAAVVYQRSASWFRIALQRGSAWVSRERPGDFQSYPDLLKDRLAYVRKGWSGLLWQMPGAGSGARVPSAWSHYFSEDIPVEVLEFRRIGGDAWIKVRLLTESCGERLEGVESATGWICAYDASNRPAAWFYARGC